MIAESDHAVFFIFVILRNVRKNKGKKNIFYTNQVYYLIGQLLQQKPINLTWQMMARNSVSGSLFTCAKSDTTLNLRVTSVQKD